MSSFNLKISPDVLPQSYKNVIVASSSRELASNDKGKVIIRSNVDSMKAIQTWIAEFSALTNTQWNVRHTNPWGQKMVCKKMYVCHHSSFKKVSRSENKKNVSKNDDCPAKISVKIKLSTTCTRRSDPFVKDGLATVIEIWTCHSHDINETQSLRFLQPDFALRSKFFEYFYDGMTVIEAKRFHESNLVANESVTKRDFENGFKNPSARTISYWYDLWKKNLNVEIDIQIDEDDEERKQFLNEELIIDTIDINPQVWNFKIFLKFVEQLEFLKEKDFSCSLIHSFVAIQHWIPTDGSIETDKMIVVDEKLESKVFIRGMRVIQDELPKQIDSYTAFFKLINLVENMPSGSEK